jgi:hypothetical protein
MKIQIEKLHTQKAESKPVSGGEGDMARDTERGLRDITIFMDSR